MGLDNKENDLESKKAHQALTQLIQPKTYISQKKDRRSVSLGVSPKTKGGIMVVYPKHKKKFEMTEEQMEEIEADAENIYGSLVNEEKIAEHINSYNQTKDEAKNIFSSY